MFLQIIIKLLYLTILLPFCGFFSVIAFFVYSNFIIYLLNLINIRPNHYKYVNYKKLKILSSKDYISEWNIVPQENKQIDKKNATIAYFVFMFCGFLANKLFLLAESFIRKLNITFLQEYDEFGEKSLSALAIFVIFFVLIMVYYLFDYIYGFITPNALNGYIDSEINESQSNNNK